MSTRASANEQCINPSGGSASTSRSDAPVGPDVSCMHCAESPTYKYDSLDILAIQRAEWEGMGAVHPSNDDDG
jgi:hypothetical protein